MAKSAPVLEPINTLPGVQPPTDKTEVQTKHYTAADKIRFFNGIPRKIGGWEGILFDYDATIDGTVRSIFTDMIDGQLTTLLGSNEKLYSLLGSRLTNITPLQTTPIAVANSLDTHYDTLGNDPLSATNGSPVITVTDADAELLEPGDTVYISGATGFAGILAGAINGDAIVRAVRAGEFDINVGTNANATATGGGASVVRSSGLITVNDTAHGQSNGDRVKIAGATDTGGILAAQINAEFIIRNVLVDSFDVMTTGQATSSVTAGGGASTEYSQEIPPGLLNETNVQGYGAGLYGVGLYGTALVSSTARAYPRIWFSDRYGDTVITTPGNQTGVYQWQASNAVAPELVANAPTAVNYAFVSNNILVTLGAGGVENRIFASDLNDITVWSSSSTNQVFDDDVEGAGRLTSHCPVEDYNLIFTEYKTYTFRYIGLPFVWEIKPLDETIGLIAPMARVPVKGMAFWMGLENFYMYRGGTVEVIPANSQNESTCLRYVFDDLNWGQKSKIFAWYNKQFNEVWIHYPSSASNECDRVVVVNVQDFNWTVHNIERTAAEYPNIVLKNPRLINVGTLYQHEFGVNADGAALEFTLTSNKRYYGRSNVNLTRIIPDSIQGGTVNFTVNSYLWPQSANPVFTGNYSVISTTEFVPSPPTGRFYQYTWAGDDVDQNWIMGEWMEELQKGPDE